MLLPEGIYTARITVAENGQIDYEILSGPFKGEHAASWYAMDDPRMIPGVHVGRIAIRHEEDTMDGNIDTVREALETLCEALELALARLGVCGQGDGADHKADADSIGGTNALTMGRAALAALSAIDPGAIRRECAEKAEYWYTQVLCVPEGKLSKGLYRYVLSAEPAQEEP